MDEISALFKELSVASNRKLIFPTKGKERLYAKCTVQNCDVHFAARFRKKDGQ